MDIKNELLKEHSKNQADKIAGYINNNSLRFKELVELLFDQEHGVSQRAAMAMSHTVDQHPSLLIPHLDRLIHNLNNNIHIAVVRNTIRLLQEVTIPEHLLGATTEICFRLLQSSDTPIAVKVFSMTVLSNICEQEPDLANELKLVIESQLPFGSVGFKNRGGKILKKLNNLLHQ